MSDLLEVRGVHAGYGDLPVLEDVDLTVTAGQVVCVLGPNGAGKTTLLRTIAGAIAPTAGTIAVSGTDVTGLSADRVVPHGLALVPEGRKLFPLLTVEENLHLGAFHPAARKVRDETLEEVYGLFPTLAKRKGQDAGSMSGGEQQMCAIARGLMAKPKLLLLDEPSLGLAPVIVDQVFELIAKLAGDGLTVLIVEQNVAEALELADRAHVLEHGRFVMEGTGAELLADDRLRDAYLGVG